MTLYRAYEFATVPASSGVVDADGPVNLGTEFYVTQAGCTVTALHFGQGTGGTGNTSQVHVVGLYLLTAAGGGTLVAGPFNVTPGSANGWISTTLPTPYALTANQHYLMVVNRPAGYPTSGSYYTSGAGATNLVNGPLVVPSAANAVNPQNAYYYNNTLNVPFLGGGSNYWNDVTIDDGGAAPVSSQFVLSRRVTLG